MRLEGLENTGSRKIDPAALRAAYLAELEEHRTSLARQARALSIDLIEIDSSEGLDQVLSAYLARRAGRTHGGFSSS